MVHSRVLLFLPSCLVPPDSGHLSYPSSLKRKRASNILHNNQLDCQLFSAHHNTDIHPHSPHLDPKEDEPARHIFEHDEEHPHAVRTLPVQLHRQFDSQRTVSNN